MQTVLPAGRRAWLVPAGLVLLSLVPALAGAARLVELAGRPEVTAANERFVAMPAPVVLHLLAPNGRPQQVTEDLAGFWVRTYPMVRKELRGRDPKHKWPETPPGA